MAGWGQGRSNRGWRRRQGGAEGEEEASYLPLLRSKHDVVSDEAISVISTMALDEEVVQQGRGRFAEGGETTDVLVTISGWGLTTRGGVRESPMEGEM